MHFVIPVSVGTDLKLINAFLHGVVQIRRHRYRFSLIFLSHLWIGCFLFGGRFTLTMQIGMSHFQIVIFFKRELNILSLLVALEGAGSRGQLLDPAGVR